MVTERSTQPRPGQTPRLARPTPSCCARPARPTSRRRSARSCASTTAAPGYLLESVEGGERLGRYSFLGVGPRRLLQVRDGRGAPPDPSDRGRRVRARPARRGLRRRRSARGAARLHAPPTRRPARGDAAVHRRCRGRARLRRRRRLRADGAAARGRPGRRSHGGVHRVRPRPRLRPPDPHAVGDRVAAHRGARPRGPLCDRGAGDLRGARAHGPPVRGRARGRVGPQRLGRGRESSTIDEGDIRVSLRREEYEDAVRVAKDAIAAGEAIQVVLARRQSIELPRGADGRPLAGHRALPRAPAHQPEPVPVLRAHADVRGGRAPRPSCCSRSRATG